MKISMIAAMAENRVIGKKDGGIPWELPRDSRHFREYTADKFMLLGRATFEEMDGWFKTQTPIVLTGRADYQVADGFSVTSVADAIRVAGEQNADQLVVSGGASVYEAALPFADQLVLTLVHTKVDGARFFPDYEAAGEWTQISEERYEADEENEYAMTFITLARKT